jgi:hypothetical protein
MVSTVLGAKVNACKCTETFVSSDPKNSTNELYPTVQYDRKPTQGAQKVASDFCGELGDLAEQTY